MLYQPKILVGTLFSEVKDYVIKDWYKNSICKLTYPSFDFCAIDNSKDPKYHRRIYHFFDNLKKKSNIDKLTVIHTPRTHVKSEVFMADSQNALRKHFLENGYDWLFLKECDVYTPPDVIERLLGYNTQIISALYFTGDKSNSYPVISNLRHFFNGNPRIYVKSYLEGFYDIGEIEIPKEVLNAGLGCTLIYKDVLQKISFRYDNQFMVHNDTMFAKDLRDNKIQNLYVPIMCRHENQNWDIQRKMIQS